MSGELENIKGDFRARNRSFVLELNEAIDSFSSVKDEATNCHSTVGTALWYNKRVVNYRSAETLSFNNCHSTVGAALWYNKKLIYAEVLKRILLILTWLNP